MFVSLFRASHAGAAGLLLRPPSGTFRWVGAFLAFRNDSGAAPLKISPDTWDGW